MKTSAKAVKSVDRMKLKSYGHSKSSELRNLGLTVAEVNGWWTLKYKKKVTPKQYAYLLFDKELRWDMLMSATCKADLKRLNFPLLHLSYPMAMDLVLVICGLRGTQQVKPSVLQDYLRTGIEVPSDGNGTWSF